MSHYTLSDNHGWFKQLFDLSPDPTWIIENNQFVACNDAAVRTLGYSSHEELRNVHPSKLSPPKQPDGEDSFVKAERMLAAAKDKDVQRFEWVHTKADGTNFYAEVTLSSIKLEHRQVIYCVWRDITDRKAAEAEIRNLAFYDTLTKLPNRRLLIDRLIQAMAASKRRGCYGAVMFLDLDNFKPLNDAYGHMVGDLLLTEAASRLKSGIREMDTVARFGGDEFVVVAGELDTNESASRAQAEVIAEKIRSVLSEPYRLAIQYEREPHRVIEHQCSVCIGIALFFNHEGSQDDILKWADMAMYKAKEAGRNSICFYDSSNSLS